MSKLPVISGRDAVQAFERIGYGVDHQTGSTSFFAIRTRPIVG